MTSITSSSKVFIGHPTFSRSIESHGSAHSADINYHGWRNERISASEDIGTQTEHISGGGSISGSGKLLLGELKRRREDTIVDISLESMKYNGGKIFILLTIIISSKENLPFSFCSYIYICVYSSQKD